MCFSSSKQESKQTTSTTTTSNIRDERVAAEGGSIVAAQGAEIDLVPEEAFETVDETVAVSVGAIQQLAAKALDFGGQALDTASEAAAGSAAQTAEFSQSVIERLDTSAEEQQEGQIIRLAVISVVALGAVWAVTQFGDAK